MVASCMLSGSCLFILGLGLLSCVTHASPISADYHSGLFDPKRSGSRGFHEGIFDQGFGGFSTLKKRGKRTSAEVNEVKRRPEMTSRGIHGDAFTGGFGDFYTMKRAAPASGIDEWTLAKILEALEDRDYSKRYNTFYN